MFYSREKTNSSFTVSLSVHGGASLERGYRQHMCVNENIAIVAVNKGMQWPSSHHIRAVGPEGTQDEKIRDTGPRAEAHSQGMVSVSPDSCIFPYTEKHQIP